MNCRFCLPLVAASVLAAGLAFAQGAGESKKPSVPPVAGDHKMELPPGWTEADMQACMEAGTPGPQHAFLTKAAGSWTGTGKHWMAPNTDPISAPCSVTITPMFDGRFVKVEWSGEMPGMGTFNGFGLNGYDNVGQEFQSTWCDNMGTGMAIGTGSLSSDQSTLTWNYTFNCPVTKKPAKMREIEKVTGADARSMEMWMTDPKTGKEFKMMEIQFTRAGKASAALGH